MRTSREKVIAMIILCLFTGGMLQVGMAWGAETLTVTRDHFEFRDAPRVAEDTLIGTLRTGTEVEWTGTVSGDWFQVRGPGNQLGWIHRSGLSTPRTAPTSQQPPVSAPASTSSRSVTRAPSGSTLEKQIQDLEKANTQYKALLDEKERRMAELTQEIETLEQKLVDTSQQMTDTQQMREMQQAQLTEIESRLEELRETLKQKDEELLQGKVELTKLQNQLSNLQEQAQQVRPVERLILYGLNGLLGVLLLGAVVLYIRQHKAREKPTMPPAERRTEHVRSGTSGRPGQAQKDAQESSPVSPEAPGNEPIEEEAEDVVIELSDVLPATDLDTPDKTAHEGEQTGEDQIEDIDDIEIVSENDIEVVEEIEVVDEESEAVGEPETIEEVDVIEEAEAIDDIDIIAAEDMEDKIEAVAVEEIEEIEEIDEVDDLDEIDVLEDLEVFSDEGEDEGIGLEDEIEETSLHEDLEELETHLESPADDVSSDFDFDAIYGDTFPEPDETFTAGEVPSEPVEVGGETFEKLVEQNTQIIDAEEDEEFEEEILTAPKAFEEEPDIEPEELSTLKEDIEDLSDLLEAREMELEEIHNYDAYASHEPEEPAEPDLPSEVDVLMDDLHDDELMEMIDEEEIEDIEELEVIEEVEDFEAEEEPAFESAEAESPDFLEPSPVLIEPEYEPEEVTLAPAPENVPSPGHPPKAPTYEIELVQVGDNTDQIVEFLSKVKGLPKPPTELIQKVPTIITRDAKETDAKNFQLLMQKLGAKVRLIAH